MTNTSQYDPNKKLSLVVNSQEEMDTANEIVTNLVPYHLQKGYIHAGIASMYRQIADDTNKNIQLVLDITNKGTQDTLCYFQVYLYNGKVYHTDDMSWHDRSGPYIDIRVKKDKTVEIIHFGQRYFFEKKMLQDDYFQGYIDNIHDPVKRENANKIREIVGENMKIITTIPENDTKEDYIGTIMTFDQFLEKLRSIQY